MKIEEIIPTKPLVDVLWVAQLVDKIIAGLVIATAISAVALGNSHWLTVTLFVILCAVITYKIELASKIDTAYIQYAIDLAKEMGKV